MQLWNLNIINNSSPYCTFSAKWYNRDRSNGQGNRNARPAKPGFALSFPEGRASREIDTLLMRLGSKQIVSFKNTFRQDCTAKKIDADSIEFKLSQRDELPAVTITVTNRGAKTVEPPDAIYWRKGKVTENALGILARNALEALSHT